MQAALLSNNPPPATREPPLHKGASAISALFHLHSRWFIFAEAALKNTAFLTPLGEKCGIFLFNKIGLGHTSRLPQQCLYRVMGQQQRMCGVKYP